MAASLRLVWSEAIGVGFPPVPYLHISSKAVPLEQFTRGSVLASANDRRMVHLQCCTHARRHPVYGRFFPPIRPYTRCPATASTPEPEGGARCVSSACRNLCGGEEKSSSYRNHHAMAVRQG